MNVSRIALAGGVAATTVLLLAGTASAHVSVQPQGEAAKGGYAVINFKVPNERDDASTTKLEVNLPTDHPLASVQPQPVPGWDIKVTTSKLAKPLDMHGKKINEAVSKVTWTADGGKIEPGRFQQFPLSVGQLPEDADQLVFKAIQTYDDKEVVRWIEEQKDGAEEPESPAPVLKLTAASDDAHGAAAATGSDDKSGAADHAKDEKTTASASSSSSDTTARVLGILGIVIGVAGVAFGVLAGRRRTA
ncbi:MULTISPECIES: YcnI family protein [unclassified Streptomyces]|uniref:YcnI family copper-binding membrane protein n=1 Tax=unclassified Streptomyces TaxID=2593676 RepID=UPI002033B751|nr:YcnI family protein [Streptomyces sp. RKAG290]MCM2412869.1 YcnI family protein [Streptomyces sp. RKAG290]